MLCVFLLKRIAVSNGLIVARNNPTLECFACDDLHELFVQVRHVDVTFSRDSLARSFLQYDLTQNGRILQMLTSLGIGRDRLEAVQVPQPLVVRGADRRSDDESLEWPNLPNISCVILRDDEFPRLREDAPAAQLRNAQKVRVVHMSVRVHVGGTTDEGDLVEGSRAGTVNRHRSQVAKS